MSHRRWRGGRIAEGVTKVNIGFNNLEYSYFPARTKVKAGTAVTFANVGDIPHTATAYQQGNWDTGAPPSRRRAGRWPRARNSPARRQIPHCLARNVPGS
jgi:plastocyanin